MKRLICLITVTLMIAGLSGACKPISGSMPTPGASSAPPSASTPGAQDKADELGRFKTVDLSGKAYDYTMFYSNKLTMVNVWTTWCGYCVEEMPNLAKLSQEYSGKGFAIVGILGDSVKSYTDNPERDDNAIKTGLQIMQQTGVQYPVLQPDGVLSHLLNDLDGYPTTYFINGNGKLVGKVVGARSYDGWKAQIDALLSKVE